MMKSIQQNANRHIQSNPALKKKKQLEIIDYINGSIYGYTNIQNKLQGFGIAIDDEFNIFISDWKNGKLNGYSFIHFVNDNISLCCQFINNKIKGTAFLKHQNELIYTTFPEKKTENIKQQYFIAQSRDKILYIGSLKLSSIQQQPASITVSNRLTNNEHNLFSISQKLLSISIQQYHKSTNFYLQFLTELCPLLSLQQIDENLLLFGMKFQRNHENKNFIGFQLNQLDSIYSVGIFNNKLELNGIGLNSTRSRDKFMGVFKNNLLTKQIQEKENSQIKSSHRQAKNTKQQFRKQRMRSLNYCHQLIFYPQLVKIKKLAQSISRYIINFEDELANTHYQQDSSSEQLQNKYNEIDSEKPLQRTVQKNRYDSNSIVKLYPLNTSQQQNVYKPTPQKRPGFIYRKQKSKSPQNYKSRPKFQRLSPIASIHTIQTSRNTVQNSPKKQNYIKWKA